MKLQTPLSVFCFVMLGWDSAHCISPQPPGSSLVLSIGSARGRLESSRPGDRTCSFLFTCCLCPSIGALCPEAAVVSRLIQYQAHCIPSRSQHQPGSSPLADRVPALQIPFPKLESLAAVGHTEPWGPSFKLQVHQQPPTPLRSRSQRCRVPPGSF